MVALGALFIPVFYTFAALGPNLVQNGNLETASSNASIPEGWSTDKWGTITASFSYPVAGNGSAKAAKVQVTSRSSGDAKWYFNHMPVKAGEVYQFSDEYSSNKATSISVEYKLQNGSFSYAWLGSPASSNNTWKAFTKQFTVPANAVSMSVLHSIASVGVLTVDTISLQKAGVGDLPPPPPTDTCPNVPGTQTSTPCADATCVNQGGTWNGSSCDMPTPPPTTSNLITNGNLDAGTGGVPQAWVKGNWGTITPVFTYPVAGKSGNAAKLQVTSYTSGDAKWIHSNVTVESGKTYTYTDDYISDKATNITAEFKLSNGSSSYVWLGNAPAASSWGTFTKQFTVPSEAVSVSVMHILASVGTLTIDNAILKKDDGTTTPPPPPPSGTAFSEGMVTISFDDSWLSQYTNALPILETAGIKGTFYLTTEPIQFLWDGFMTTVQVKDLVARGHDIGGHTVTHSNLAQLSSTKLNQELVNSKNYLQNLTGTTITALAYPYGAYNSAVKTAAKNAGYSTARSVEEDTLNLPATDKFVLKSLIPELNTQMSQIKTAIDEAKSKKQWLIIGFHEINNSGDQYSNTPAQLQETVNYIRSTGIKTVTVKQGAALLAQ